VVDREHPDPAQLNERANANVERQMPDGAQGRQRFILTCPRCRKKPVLRQNTIDEMLASEYGQNLQQKVVYLPV